MGERVAFTRISKCVPCACNFTALSDRPLDAGLYQTTGNGVTNLTCWSRHSHPPATIRWFLNEHDISEHAEKPYMEMDNSTGKQRPL